MNAPLHREMPDGLLDSARALNDVTQAWDRTIVPELKNYIEIPAKSPSFDADWAVHGHIETVLRNAAQWVEAQKVEGLHWRSFACRAARPSCSLKWPPHAPPAKARAKRC
jgi:hypothetical protein